MEDRMVALLLAPACRAPEGAERPDLTGSPTDPAGDADTDTDADSDADTDADSDADTDADPGSTFRGWSRVDDGSAAVIANSEAVAIDPDGRIFASWGVDGGDLRTARSDDGGATFAAAIAAESGDLAPLISMARRPWIATDGVRVAIAFDDADAAWTVTASADDLQFADPVPSGDGLGGFVDFARPAFGPDGDLWVGYQAFPSSGARMYVGRESAGFAPEVASDGSPGVPCECCPLDLAFDPDGDALLAYRNNDDDLREMWVARAEAPASSFGGWTQASITEEQLDVCPMQGPRLAGTSTLSMTWSTRGPTDPGAAVVASSADRGQTWGAATVVYPRGSDPSLAELDGELFLTAVTGPSTAELAISPDGGATWVGQGPITSPGGALGIPQLAAGGGRVALVGTTEGGEVWVEVLR